MVISDNITQVLIYNRSLAQQAGDPRYGAASTKAQSGKVGLLPVHENRYGTSVPPLRPRAKAAIGSLSVSLFSASTSARKLRRRIGRE